MSEKPAQIQFALISHTNAGKTTLARTLIGVDVGEVRDEPHVTTVSESHVLIRSDCGDRLELWDTPGFGDSARLFKRLAMSGNPIGWFLREVVDRIADKPFWLSQQAVRTARDSCDVVLYLVNSSEDPRDAGYIAAEMKILQWLGKPVVILLNQMGPPRPAVEEHTEEERWRNHFDDYSVVRQVLPLDAFARCWVHERVFYEAVGALIPPGKIDAYWRLFLVWEQENKRRFSEAMELMAAALVDAARDSEPVDDGDGAVINTVMSAVGLGKKREQGRKDEAMKKLMSRLSEKTRTTTVSLLRLYRLDAGALETINERVNDVFVVREPIDKLQAGLFGAVITGAATGLKADVLSGGLTHGAGALIGGIVGAITFAGAAWGFNASTDRDDTAVHFSDNFLRSLLVAALLRYLAVTHFGRGRGKFVQSEAPEFWQREVEDSLKRYETEVSEALKGVRSDSAGRSASNLAAAMAVVSQDVLNRLHPIG